MKTEYLLIGQGLAGTFLAHQLLRHGHDFLVIDPGEHNASKTASGLYNPVVLKRFSGVWQAEQQIATARQTLAELGEMLGLELDTPLDILRVFSTPNDRHAWHKKAAGLSAWLDTEVHSSPHPLINAPLGLGRVKGGGRAAVGDLLAGFRQYLLDKSRLRSQHCDYERLQFGADGVRYDDIVADKVVCCEGYGIKQNHYFKELPLVGNKGEVVIVRLPQLALQAAVKAGVFILPQPNWGENVYVLGASYQHTNKDNIVSEAAKQQLLEKLRQFYCGDIEVLAQKAAVRPTVIDRRPLLGRHCRHENLYVLNGLGTRGVMLGATAAKWLYNLIEHRQNLPQEVDIARFSVCNGRC